MKDYFQVLTTPDIKNKASGAGEMAREVGLSTSEVSMVTSVQIPSSHVKSRTWLHTIKTSVEDGDSKVDYWGYLQVQ